MSDDYNSYKPNLTSPTEDGEEVDISSTDHTFTKTTRALWVGSAGDVKAVTSKGTTLTRKNVPVGLYPWRLTSIVRTGTTAGDMVGEW